VAQSILAAKRTVVIRASYHGWEFGIVYFSKLGGTVLATEVENLQMFSGGGTGTRGMIPS
jgi:hypothetical protein